MCGLLSPMILQVGPESLLEHINSRPIAVISTVITVVTVTTTLLSVVVLLLLLLVVLVLLKYLPLSLLLLLLFVSHKSHKIPDLCSGRIINRSRIFLAVMFVALLLALLGH